MTGNISPFRIDIIDANDNLVGGGPIANAFNLNDTRTLDGIGRLNFSMPAGDRKAKFIQSGVKFDIWDEVDGYLGRFIFSKKVIRDRNGNAVLDVTCYDALRLLTFKTVGFFRSYNYVTVSSILSEIVGLVSGYAVDISSNKNAQITYSGESVFRAIDELRDRTGEHFRLAFSGNSKTPVLEFGPFGDVSPVQFTQFTGQIQPEWDRNPNNAILLEMDVEEESEEIFNKIFPLGFGQGVSQLTIENATLGEYTVQSETNDDGSLRYFIADVGSISDYGTREKILQFPNIRPISNSTANEENAANALKLTAEAYIKRHLAPKVHYKTSVVGLRQNVKPGDKIHLNYSGVKLGVNYLTVDDDFWVMEITRNRSASGDRSQTIMVSLVDDKRTSDNDIIVDVIRDVRDLSVHVPATLAYSPIGPYTKRILGDAVEANRINSTFNVRIKDEVLYLNRALLRFGTEPLKSSAIGADHAHLMFSQPAVGSYTTTTGQTVCADGVGASGLWNLNMEFQSTNFPNTPLYTFSASGGAETIEYGVFEDTELPDNVGIIINGVDVTLELGGPFDVSGIGISNQEIDITQYFEDAIGGIRQTHSIVFYAEGGRGEIEVEVDLLVTIQPIAVT